VTLGNAAALASWLFLVNRVIIHWDDGPLKTAAMAILLVLLGCVGVMPIARNWRGPRARSCAGLLLLFALGEGRRGWLRHPYAAADTDQSLTHFTQ
jgi:hypothetical protein